MLKDKLQKSSFKKKAKPEQRKGVERPTTKPSPYVERTLACRHEMKYLVSDANAEAIIQYIRHFLQPDRYSKLQPRGFYPIVSLYLDSDDLHLCRESLTGQKNRFKLRIRSYTDELDYPRFFEIKRRINNVIVKSRARIMDRHVQTLLEGLRLPPQSYTTDEQVLNQFNLYVSSIKAKPVILIRYMRKAYENNSENRVRVTFDRELYYKVTNNSEVRLDGQGWQSHPFTRGSVILEIKFTDRYPAWLSYIVECFNLRQRSISKYATSIEQSCLLGFCAPRLRE
jgi:hypothetical protein